jgi:flagellar motor switch protein FliM
MNQLLTQRDVDAILRGGESGPKEDDAPPVVPYSFLPTRRVTKEIRIALDAICSRYASSLQGWLSLRLRTQSEVSVTAVELVAMPDFLLSLPTPCAAFRFPVSDRPGVQGAIDFGSEFAFGLVDRMFGGSGEIRGAKRPLTKLEQKVVREIADHAIRLLGDAWPEPFSQSRRTLSFESDPPALQIASADEDVVVIILEVRSGACTGFVTLGLPIAVIRPFMKEKGTARAYRVRSGSSDAKAARAQIETGLSTARVTLIARLPVFRLSARNLSGLREGQVIDTSHSAEAPVEVQINGNPRYRATIGQVRGRVGLKMHDMESTPVPERPDGVKEGRVL